MQEQTLVFRHPPYIYLHLRVISSSSASAPNGASQMQLDEVTILAHISTALKQSFGLTGSSIPIDILKVSGVDFWLRIARDDESVFVAAVTSYVSGDGSGGKAMTGGRSAEGAKGMTLRIVSRGTWLGKLVAEAAVVKENVWSLDGDDGNG